MHLKRHLLFVVAIIPLLLLGGCMGSDYDVTFPEGENIIIPPEGGTYHFNVGFIHTKTSYADWHRCFEYRIGIDGEIIDQRLATRLQQYLYETGVVEIPFTVPANETPKQRLVTVEVLLAKDLAKYDTHVDAGDNEWELVWKAPQLDANYQVTTP